MTYHDTRPLERKDENGGKKIDENATETKQAFADFMGAFEEFKSANDERLAEIEKKGTADPLLDDKLKKIETDMVKSEDFNQQVTLQQKRDEKADEMQKQLDEALTAFNRSGTGGSEEKAEQEKEYKAAFHDYLVKSEHHISQDTRKTLEEKALTIGADTTGGYYLTPAAMESEINKAIIEASPMRSIARVTQIGGASYKIAKRTGTSPATWIGETDARSESTGYGTGLDEITARELYAHYHMSNQMLEDSHFNMEAEMGLEFSEQFALAEGKAFVAGTGGGNNQPDGFMTATGMVNTDTGDAALITADSIITMHHSIKSGYASNAVSVLNRQTLGEVRKLKGSDGHYLWAPGIAVGQPNTILGKSYVEMPDMPAVAAGLVPMAFGDFRRAYRIIDRVGMTVLRDPYTGADNGLVKYKGRKRVGGKTILAEAIATLTVAA